MSSDSWHYMSRLNLSFIRQAEEIRRQLNPMSSVIESIRQTEEMRRTLDPMASMLESIRRNQVTWADQLRGADSLVEWQSSINGILSQFRSTQQLLAELQLETSRWSSLLSEVRSDMAPSYLQGLSLPATVWQDSVFHIAESFERHRLPDAFPRLVQNLLVPHQHFSSFSRSLVASLEQGVGAHEEAAISGALSLAEHQLSASTTITAELLDGLDPEQGSDVLAPAPVVNLFGLQRIQLLSHADVEEVSTNDELVLLSTAAKINSLARRVAEGVVRCNQTARIAGADEVFTPTTRLLDAQSKLQWLTAQDEDDMGVVIDALYFVLYEGAGADHLRFLQYLQDTECEIIWIVKHLRNRFFRHDADHGSEANQRKAWREVAEALHALGFDRMPTTADGFQRMQEELLKRVRVFLETLWTRIPGVGE